MSFKHSKALPAELTIECAYKVPHDNKKTREDMSIMELVLKIKEIVESHNLTVTDFSRSYRNESYYFTYTLDKLID